MAGQTQKRLYLLQYYARLHEPMPTDHWKERSWYTRRPCHARFREEEEEDDEVLDLSRASDSGLDPQLWE